MAKKQPTQEELNQQIAAIQSQLAQTKTNLTATNPTASSYFMANTNEEVLTKKDVPTFSSGYNSAFDAAKDIKLDVGVANLPSGNQSQAFYLFDANRYANKVAQQNIDAVTKNNTNFDAQQKRIADYIEQQKNSASNKVFDTYFNDIVKSNYADLNRGFINSDSPLFSKDKFQKVRERTSHLVPMQDAAGRTYYKTVLAYKDEEASKQMRASLRESYLQTFNKDDTLRKKYIDAYAKDLTKQQSALQNQLNKLTGKK